ncbi:hypothetical protein BGZ80_005266, partial [Entomortierella chlamydospora]
MSNPAKTETFEETIAHVTEQGLLPSTGGHGAAVGTVLEHKHHHEGEHKHHHEGEHHHHHEHKPQDPLESLTQNYGMSGTHQPT